MSTAMTFYHVSSERMMLIRRRAEDIIAAIDRGESRLRVDSLIEGLVTQAGIEKAEQNS